MTEGAEGAQISLEKQVERLSKRLKELEDKRNHIMNLSEKECVSTASPLILKISGHLNRSVVWHGNGQNSNIVHADINNSPSRINFTALGNLREGTKIGAVIEEALDPNSTSRIDIQDANDTASFSHRKIEVFIDDKIWGKVFLGQGPMVSDSTMEQPDMSGTTVIALGSSVAFMGAGIQFFDANTNEKATLNGQRVTVGRAFDPSDGLGRRNRIRYDSPQFYGVSLQGSHNYEGRNENWDVAVKYAGHFNGIKIAAQGAYLHNLSHVVSLPVGSEPAKYTQMNGSFGVLFPSGISFFASTLQRDWKRSRARKGRIYFAKLGYQRSFVEAGRTAVAIDYGQYKNLIFDTRSTNERDRFKGTSYGVTLVQFLDRISTELFLGARLYHLDGPSYQAPRYKKAKLILSGARVKF